MESFENIEYGQLILKLLNRDVSKEEVRMLKDWIKSSPENHNYYLQTKNLWEISSKPFLISEKKTETALLSVFEHSQISKSKTFWHYWQKIAAVLILPLLMSGLIWIFFHAKEEPKNKIAFNELFTPFGSRSSVKLSDGSLVWLNSGSTLKYPDHFRSDERLVFLTGEAYFEVNANTLWPFIVETSKVRVKATGTVFNVKELTSSNQIEVTLAKGKVSVFKTGTLDEQLIANLHPNQHLNYKTIEGTQSLQDDDAYLFYAWKDGKMVFRNDSLAHVVKELNQFFNVDIEIQGKEVGGLIVRGTFENESLNEILKLLKIISPINYRETKRTQLSRDRFSKRNIIIFANRN